MLKNKVLAALSLFILICGLFKPSYVKAVQLEQLGDNGKNTCGFLNSGIAEVGRSRNLRPAHKFCHATLISRTKVLMSDSSCWEQKYKSNQEKRLSCNGSRQIYQLPHLSESKKLPSGQQVVELPSPLPYAPQKLAQDIAQKENFVLKTPERCHVESATQTLPLSQLEVRKSEDTSTTIVDSSDKSILKDGAHLTCQDDRGESFIVAQIKKNGELWPDLNEQWPKDFFENPPVHFYPEPNQFEQIRLLCQESGECLEQIGNQTRELSADIISIIEQLNNEYKDQDLERSHIELKNEFQELLLKCQDVAWQLQRSEDAISESGLTSRIVGPLEAFSLNVAERLDNDFLVQEFMGIDLISQELSEDQVQDVVRQVARQAREQDLGGIQRVAQTALQLSEDVVEGMLKKMNPDLSKTQQESLWQDLSEDYRECLGEAKNINAIKECSDKFSLTAPTLIAKNELERQLELNFKQRVPESDYPDLKEQAQIAYQRCLQKFYYPEQAHEQLNNSQRIQACVYDGILSGYKNTARSQISENLSGLTDNPNIIESAQIMSLEQAQKCDYGAIFHRQEKRTKQDYETMARLSTSDFQEALEDCSEELTKTAGEHIVKQTIIQTPEVIESLNESQRSEFSEKAIRDYYSPCLEAQSSPDPKNCETMIKDLVTLQVATPMMTQAIDEQMEQISSTNPKSKKDAGYIKEDVIQSMNACHDKLKDRHLKALQEKDSPLSEQAIECLEKGIRLVAKGTSQKVIEDGIKTNPQTRDFAQSILSNTELQTLPDKTADCFGERVAKLERAEQLSERLPEITKECTLETQKTATLLSLRPIMDEKLKSSLPHKTQRQAFIEDLFNEKDGPGSAIKAAKSQEELDAFLNRIPALVAGRVAKLSIPELVQDYLGEFISSDKQNKIAGEIIDELEGCLEDSGDSQKELDKCVNQTTLIGHLKLLEQIVYFTALENLNNDARTASQLVADSQRRLKKCLNKISQNISTEKFNQELEPCIIDEISMISRDIPREAILSNASLMKSKYSKDDLREQMKKIEQFYLFKGELKEVDDSDPALSSYMSLNSCLASTRYEVRKSRADLDKAQKMYEKCTTGVKDSVSNAVKRGFIQGDYEGQDETHYSALNMAAETLLQLTGKTKTQVQEQFKQDDPQQETLELLELVGQNTVIACNYDAQRCETELEATQKEVLRYKENNPEATSEEIQAKFIHSPFIKLVIEANIAQTLRTELSASLQQYEDSEGLLQEQIEKITSPSVIKDIMQNRYGQGVSELVAKAIKEGEVESVVNDPTTRSALGLALVENTNDDSFVDQLLFGLVQPQLTQQKDTSSGVGGLFSNTTVTLGRLLGVVRGKDFDWRRVRQTPQGRKAREIFAKDVLLPVLQGEDLSKVSPENSQKSLQDIHLERIQSLIEEGIKKLSQ